MYKPFFLFIVGYTSLSELHGGFLLFRDKAERRPWILEKSISKIDRTGHTSKNLLPWNKVLPAGFLNVRIHPSVLGKFTGM